MVTRMFKLSALLATLVLCVGCGVTVQPTRAPGPTQPASEPSLFTSRYGLVQATVPTTWWRAPVQAPSGLGSVSSPLHLLSNVEVDTFACMGGYDPRPKPPNCTSYQIAALSAGGVVLTIGTNPSNSRVMPATVVFQAATGECLTLDGEAQWTSVVGPAVVAACLRGPDLDRLEAEVRAVILSMSPVYP
jgi:hypothetical protein